MAPHVGTVLGGRYELTRHIARGGMGDVYEGRDALLERRVAVKLYRASSPTDRERFDGEVRVLAALTHPGLVRVYDAGTVDDDAFVVLELLDGPPLSARMAEGPLPPAEVAAIGVSIADALQFIHGRGVVHRDVTPSNVMCDEGRARLVDFGIARLLDSPRVTAPETTIGTVAYMAPEQVRGVEVSGAADIYSLGLLLLEALTGRKEYSGPPQEVAVVRLVRPPDTTTGVPPAWTALLSAMCAAEPVERPTAAEVRAELEALAELAQPAATATAAAVPMFGRGGARRTATGRASSRRRATLPAVAAAIAVAAVSAVVLPGLGGSAGPPADAGTTSTTTVVGTADPISTARAGSRTAATDALPAATGAEEIAEDIEATGAGEDGPTTTGPAGGVPTIPTRPTRPTSTTVAPTTTAAPSPTTTSPPASSSTTSPPTTEATVSL